MTHAKLFWGTLEKYDVTTEDALTIFVKVPSVQQDIATYVLKKDPDRKTLLTLLQPENKLAVNTLQEVTKKLLEGSPTQEELIAIVIACSSRRGFYCQEGEKAWKKLQESNPDIVQIRTVAEGSHCLREEAWEMILDREPTNNDLCHVMAFLPELEERAWQIFQKREPSKADLHQLIRKVGERDEIGKRARTILEEMRDEGEEQEET